MALTRDLFVLFLVVARISVQENRAEGTLALGPKGYPSFYDQHLCGFFFLATWHSLLFWTGIDADLVCVPARAEQGGRRVKG